MSLADAQHTFTRLVGQLITWAYSQGYQLSLGECWRTPEQAKWNEEHGLGIACSLHCERLAIDLNLFRDGIWLRDPQSYRPLGDYWVGLHADARWGGNFHSVDAPHFSLSIGDGRA